VTIALLLQISFGKVKLRFPLFQCDTRSRRLDGNFVILVAEMYAKQCTACESAEGVYWNKIERSENILFRDQGRS
jgi:hypothetical protein